MPEELSSFALPDQAGRTWLVTGATSGIGRVTAVAAAKAGARVLAPVRNEAKGEDLARAIHGMGGEVILGHADLSDQATVQAYAESIDEPIDVLMNNGGTVTQRLQRNDAGHELMLATNFLGPFALTNLLAPQLRGRVVVVGSGVHRAGRVDALDPDFRHRRWSIMAAYGQSKLADMLWARALQTRLDGIDVQLADPGWSATGLPRAAENKVVRTVADAASRTFGQSAEDGAKPLIAAAAADLPPLSMLGPDGPGGLTGNPAIHLPSPLARDDDAAEAVWQLGVRLTGTDL